MDGVTWPQLPASRSRRCGGGSTGSPGSAVVVAARAWSAEVSRVVAEVEVHLRELGDDDHRAAASLARLDVVLDLVDELAALGPLGP